MDVSEVKAGDILFFVSSGSLFDRLISWWTHNRFVHVAVAIGDGHKIEALGQGVVKDNVTDATAAIWHPPTGAYNALGDALEWLGKQVGKPYGWGDIMDSVDRTHTFYFVQAGHVDCSVLAAEFLELAGFSLGPLSVRGLHTVTPGDLAKYLKVR